MQYRLTESLVACDRASRSLYDDVYLVRRGSYSLPLIDALYNPVLLCPRTPLLKWTGEIASLCDVLHDWRRCFVVFSDWLRSLPEFGLLSQEDQASPPALMLTVSSLSLCKADGFRFIGGCLETGRQKRIAMEFA